MAQIDSLTQIKEIKFSSINRVKVSERVFGVKYNNEKYGIIKN